MLGKGQTQNPGTKESTAPATINPSLAKSIAEQIDKSGGEYTWTKGDSVLDAFKQIKNDADFDLVNATFGVRTEYDSLLSKKDMNMTDMINRDHSPDTVKAINDYLTKQGLTKSI